MSVRILLGDVRAKLAELATESVHCVVTSPPYFGLRDYGIDGQIGLESTPEAYVAVLVEVFREVRRVLRSDGTLWLNLGDSYSSGGRTTQAEPGEGVGHRGMRGEVKARPIDNAKPKDLLGIPWRVAFALQADGWYLRSEIIWHKPNPMPESVTDRPTKAHEQIFLLSKSPRYHYDAEAIAEDSEGTAYERRLREEANGKLYSRGPGHDGRNDFGGSCIAATGPTRNRRSVWTVATQPFKEAHFATFPPDLIEPCILAGCPKGGTVLDPFGGAGTTGLVADRLQRSAILIELNPAYLELAASRITDDAPLFASLEKR